MPFRILLLVLGVMGCWVQPAAQGLSVENFAPLPNDMTARTLAPERDANGELTALIKVVSTSSGFVFEGGSLGIVKALQKEGEWWVYVPSGARTLTIRHPQLGVLRNYAYPVAITAGSVYEMQLVHGELEVSVKEKQLSTEFVIITSEPPGADVYLNNEPVGKTPFSAEKTEGQYEWRVAHELYLPEAGAFMLTAGEKQKLNLNLKPNFGTLQVVSVPEAGASITLNGVKLGKTTTSVLQEIPSGEQTLTLSHEWYETTTRKVTVSAGKTENISITMQPNFGELTVAVPDEEEVYINDDYQGSGRWTGRLAPGVYRVEVRKEGHKSAVRQLSLSRGDKETLTIVPEPILSNLKVVSEPMDADIYLNGERVGTTPQILRDLLVGEYQLELQLKGYGSVKRKVVVKEGEVLEVNLGLPSAGSLYFTSDPPGAQLSMNGSFKGKTPYTVTDLPAGSYNYELSKEGYETLRATAKVDAGRKSNIDNELIKEIKSVKIGNQVWMAENLNVNKFRNGDAIPHARTYEEWERAGTNGQPAWCYYGNNPANGAKYGKLYNWYAVNDPRGLAPEGWHIPSDAEWTKLIDFLGGEDLAGDKMKNEIGWKTSGNGSNKSGFSGLPGGGRIDNGAFKNIGYLGYWWSSSGDNPGISWHRVLRYYSSKVSRNGYDNTFGFSVRCLRD